MNTLNLSILRSDKALPFGFPANELFGGRLLWIQQLDLLPFIRGCLLLLAVWCLLRKHVKPRVWSAVSLIAVFVLSAALSFKTATGWDELFIGVKHAYSIAVANRYSYTIQSLQEGSGDFIPIFLTGILGKLGLPLTETFLSLGLFGNLWLLAITWRIFDRFTRNDGIATLIFTLAVGVFPCVVLTSVTGFFSPLFTAGALTALDWMVLEKDPKNEKRGIFLLSILTLFRMEGIILAFLIWAYRYALLAFGSLKDAALRKSAIRRAFVVGVTLVSPFALACLARYLTFHHPLPAPVALKNAQGDRAYLESGLTYLQQVFRRFDIWALLAVTAPMALFSFFKSREFRPMLAVWAILTVFSVPYILGGGDWFPDTWARYLMTWIVGTFFVFWQSAIICFRATRARERWVPIFALVLVLIPYFVTKIYAGNRSPNAFDVTLAQFTEREFRWGRINALGYFGRFLEKTTPPDSLVASPEEATIMHYAVRDPLDMTGFALADVAYSERNPMSPGNIMHRKRNPAILMKYRPGIIALWEMSVTNPDGWNLGTDPQAADWLLDSFRKYSFTQGHVDIAYYRAGSYEYLRKLGYRLLVVGTPYSAFYYWVNDKIYPEHLAKLKELGFRELAEKKIDYQVSPAIAQKFSSGEELLSK